MMRQSFVRIPALRWALCAPLAAILILLSSRSTVECLSALVLPASSVPATSEAAAIDRKPKPTRQQDRTSIAALVRLQWLSLAKPELPATPLRDDERTTSAPRPARNSSGVDAVSFTRPAYLDPSDTAPRRQLPPPALHVPLA
jgi:hypothetical protein